MPKIQVSAMSPNTVSHVPGPYTPPTEGNKFVPSREKYDAIPSWEGKEGFSPQGWVSYSGR